PGRAGPTTVWHRRFDKSFHGPREISLCILRAITSNIKVLSPERSGSTERGPLFTVKRKYSRSFPVNSASLISNCERPLVEDFGQWRHETVTSRATVEKQAYRLLLSGQK